MGEYISKTPCYLNRNSEQQALYSFKESKTRIMTSADNKKTVYDFHQFLKSNDNIPYKLKRKLLETMVFEFCEDSWKIVGISRKCLRLYKQLDFKHQSRKGIERAHYPLSRNEVFNQILDRDFDSPEQLWDFYYERDRTVLCLSSENMKNSFDKIFPIDPNLGLFKAKNVGWHQTAKENEFLRELFYSNYQK